MALTYASAAGPLSILIPLAMMYGFRVSALLDFRLTCVFSFQALRDHDSADMVLLGSIQGGPAVD